MIPGTLEVLLFIYLSLWLVIIAQSLGHISVILERYDKRKTGKLLKNEDLEKLKKKDMSSILHHIFIAIM